MRESNKFNEYPVAPVYSWFQHYVLGWFLTKLEERELNKANKKTMARSG